MKVSQWNKLVSYSVLIVALNTCVWVIMNILESSITFCTRYIRRWTGVLGVLGNLVECTTDSYIIP
jgi:hypothetical protein